MFRTCLYMILICLVMVGCSRDSSKKPEQKSGNVDQNASDKNLKPEDALIKEIQTIAKRDFRKANWGMDKATVKLTESDDPMSEDDSAVIYSRKVAGLSTLIGYMFVKNKLVKAKYMFHPQHSDLNDYITDNNNIKKALENKYGKADKERTIWSNDLYTKIPSQWGTALGLGYLTYLSYWDAKNSEITLMLKGENDKIDLWLEYSSKALAKIEKTGKGKQQ